MFPCALNGAARFWMKHCTSPRAFSTPRSRFVLGIETSCDETGAAVLDETGVIRGESLHSQKKTHLDTGGIIPTVAQRLHRENISRVVQEALDRSGIEPSELTAVATTVKPGLALSLGVGLDFSLKFVRLHEKPFIPIHHMEAHALTVKMLHPVDFPFLVLLVSGGHSLLALAKGIDEFLLLGQTLDVAAGDTLDKIARRLSLRNHPECSTLSGGQAIELLAKEGDRLAFHFKAPMGQLYDCNFSFAGLRNQVTMAINKKEREEGVEKGHLLSCVKDIAAASQHTVASPHSRTWLWHFIFKLTRNEYIRQTLKIVTDATGLHLLCPPTKFCTDNGVMIAWNGIERLKQRKGIMSYTEEVNYEPKAPLGLDITSEVKDATIKLPPLKLRINS
uniref:N(6)-L-threonylcarbamoyladenine synthase n=1 Tax=Sinocyclocheilus grahami TaxID=75366 RepID=A0A672RSY1_SINGR